MRRDLNRQVADLERGISALHAEIARNEPTAREREAAETAKRQRCERVAWGVQQGPSSWKHLGDDEAIEAKRLYSERHSPAARDRRRKEQIESAKRVGHEPIETNW